MPQNRMTPDNYMKLHHRSLNRSIKNATDNNLSRAMDAFSNLNPAAAAKALTEEVNTNTSETYMKLDGRQALFYGVFLVTVGALGSFLGSWLFREFKKSDK